MTIGAALVSGASGFIGRALVAHLRAQGRRVIAAGRPGSALPAADRELKLAFPDPEAARTALGNERIDILFHCAAYGVPPHERDRETMIQANIAAVGAWVETAAALGASAVVYTGSCSEYGRVEREAPIGEDQSLGAVDLYGASKAAGGQWGRAVAQRLGIGFQWLRLFGVFGSGEASHRLLPHLHATLRAGERADLTLGGQWRDLLHVDDAVTGAVRAGEAALDGRCGVFNLCSGRPVTMRAVAEAAAREMGFEPDRLDFGARDYRPDEQMWMVGDPTRLAQATGFRPSIDLEDGIARVVRALDCRAGQAAGA